MAVWPDMNEGNNIFLVLSYGSHLHSSITDYIQNNFKIGSLWTSVGGNSWCGIEDLPQLMIENLTLLSGIINYKVNSWSLLLPCNRITPTIKTKNYDWILR